MIFPTSRCFTAGASFCLNSAAYRLLSMGSGPGGRILPPFVTSCLELLSILLRGSGDGSQSFTSANFCDGSIPRRRTLPWAASYARCILAGEVPTGCPIRVLRPDDPGVSLCLHSTTVSMIRPLQRRRGVEAADFNTSTPTIRMETESPSSTTGR